MRLSATQQFLLLLVVTQGSNVFAGKHGFITPRDLFRWAGRGAVGYQQVPWQPSQPDVGTAIRIRSRFPAFDVAVLLAMSRVSHFILGKLAGTVGFSSVGSTRQAALIHVLLAPRPPAIMPHLCPAMVKHVSCPCQGLNIA